MCTRQRLCTEPPQGPMAVRGELCCVSHPPKAPNAQQQIRPGVLMCTAYVIMSCQRTAHGPGRLRISYGHPRLRGRIVRRGLHYFECFTTFFLRAVCCAPTMESTFLPPIRKTKRGSAVAPNELVSSGLASTSTCENAQNRSAAVVGEHAHAHVPTIQ